MRVRWSGSGGGYTRCGALGRTTVQAADPTGTSFWVDDANPCHYIEMLEKVGAAEAEHEPEVAAARQWFATRMFDSHPLVAERRANLGC